MNNARFESWKSNFTSVTLRGVDSYVRFEGSQLENLKFDLRKSTLDIGVKKQMGSLSGSLINKSEGNFSISSVSVQLSADKSSHYRIYD